MIVFPRITFTARFYEYWTFHYRSGCINGKGPRQIYRGADQDAVDWADNCLGKSRRGYLMGRRASVVEGSFADVANNHGYKRARWRRLWRVTTQNIIIAAIQNLRKLISATFGNKRVKQNGLGLFLSFNSPFGRYIKSRRELGELLFGFIKALESILADAVKFAGECQDNRYHRLATRFA